MIRTIKIKLFYEDVVYSTRSNAGRRRGEDDEKINRNKAVISFNTKMKQSQQCGRREDDDNDNKSRSKTKSR